MQEEWSNKKIASLIQISSLINSSLDIVEVLNSAMHIAEELVDAEASAIFEIDFQKNELFFRLARGECGGKAMKSRMKMGEGVAGWVASSGEVLLVSDTCKDGRFSNKVDNTTGFKTKSIVALPVRNKGEMIGVLEVLNKRGDCSFSEEDVDILKVVAGQIGVAIDNAKLYSRLQEKFELTQDELKKSQIKLIRSERLAALGKLAHGIAHKVRNPVTSIGGFAKRIKKKAPLSGSDADYIDAIIDEAERLERMVKDVSEYTSMPEPEPGQYKISALLEHTVGLWRERNRQGDIELDLSCSPDDPVVHIDLDLMSRALLLVMKNSEESFSNGGVISISTAWEGKWVVISVRDNGRGISADDLPYVFDPFFSTKVHGSGLGLNIVNHIVSGHRGEVHISSTPENGTEVRIYFPPFSGSEL